MHHRRGLRLLLKDNELFERFVTDWEAAGLDERRLAMLRFAAKLTVSPSEITEADHRVLGDAGFEDADRLAIVEVTGYYAYANRMVDGLGVQLEDDDPSD